MYDLRTYLKKVERDAPGQLVRVWKPVSHEYDVTRRVEEEARTQGNPALLFEEVDGFSMPTLINVFGNFDRLKLALEGACSMASRLDFYSAWNELVAKKIMPIDVRDGPVKEVKQRGGGVDLESIPILRFYEQDAGRYITSGLVVARDPDHPEIVNLSYARMQLKGKNRLGTTLHSRGNMWSYFEKVKTLGRPLDVAVIIGAHPAIYMAAAAKITGEYLVGGSLLGEPLELVRCETVDIPVPARAEIVLEGSITLEEGDEGPFTEYTGYLSGRSTRNTLKVDCITHRRDAIYQTIMPSNSDEHLLLSGLPKQARIYGALRDFAPMPAIRDILWPVSGTHYVCFISLNKAMAGIPGLAKQVAILVMGLDPYIKLATVFPDDINISDLGAALGAIADRCDMVVGSGIEFLRGVFSHRLDPSSVVEGVSSKMIVDATGAKKATGKIDSNLQRRLDKLGVSEVSYPLGDSRLRVFRVSAGFDAKVILGETIEIGSLTICVDEDVDAGDVRQVIWAMSTRFQPVEDVFLVRGGMGIDGTRPEGWKAKMATIPIH